MTCYACKRTVDQLIEVVMIENQVQETIVRCQDCMGIAMDTYRSYQNFKCN